MKMTRMSGPEVATMVTAATTARPAAIGTPARIVRQTESSRPAISIRRDQLFQARAAVTSLVQAFQVSSPMFFLSTA